MIWGKFDAKIHTPLQVTDHDHVLSHPPEKSVLINGMYGIK